VAYDKLLFYELLILSGSKVVRRSGCASEPMAGNDTKMGTSQMRECNEVRPSSRVEVVKMFLEKDVHYHDHISPLPVPIF
jgi:hypothetical protein